MRKGIGRLLPDFLAAMLDGNVRVRRLRERFRFYTAVRPRLTRQLSRKTEGQGGKNTWTGVKVLVPVIETSHYQYLQILIIAKALELRGAVVKVLICGQSLDGCEIKSVKNEDDDDPCWKCRFNERKVLPLFNLDVVRLRDVLSAEEIRSLGEEAGRLVSSGTTKVIRQGVDLSQCIEDSVVRYFYGGVPRSEERVAEVRRAHTKTALTSIEIARRIDQAWTPDVVFTNMGCYSAWEPYFRFFEKHGKRFRTVSITPFDYNSVRFDLPKLFQSSERFERYRNTRDRPKLLPEERAALLEFLRERTTGQTQIFKDLAVFEESPAGGDPLRARLSIDPKKRNIFLFPNIYWDVGLSDNGGVYGDVITWVLDTIELCREADDCHLYIKPHPVEIFGPRSLKGIADFIRDRYPILPGNVTIVEPEWKLKPYDLFPFIDVGVIFTGTLGLEMMLAGIPVISTGLTSHMGLGLALEPESVGAYKAALLGETKPPAVDRDELELFAYFYFLRTLIPWRLTKQAYGNSDFSGFEIENLDDLLPGRDAMLDHLCQCILDPESTVPEAWP